MISNFPSLFFFLKPLRMWSLPSFLFKKARPMYGIDVSHHNGIIDWEKVSKNVPHIDFVFIKASEGVGGQDSRFKFNATEAKKYGLRCGYYHFCSLNDSNVVKDAKQEAEYFISLVKLVPAPEMPLVLDIELSNPKVQLSDADVVTWIKTFFVSLESAGYSNYALYSYTPFLNEHLPDNHDLGNLRLWVAAYTNLPSPKLPKGWNNYWIWQYSANGKVSGIGTNVDLNKTLKDV